MDEYDTSEPCGVEYMATFLFTDSQVFIQSDLRLAGDDKRDLCVHVCLCEKGNQ